MCASTWRLLRKWPRMNTNFTNKIRNSWPPGLLRPQTTRFSAVGSCRTGEPSPSLLTCSHSKKRKISWRPLKIEYQLLPPVPFPFPPRARGKGKLFCGVLQAGYARLQNPLIFSPLPNGANAVGEGAGGGAKATAYKGSSIAATWAKLNNDRTFSFLNDVRQHMPTPWRSSLTHTSECTPLPSAPASGRR